MTKKTFARVGAVLLSMGIVATSMLGCSSKPAKEEPKAGDKKTPVELTLWVTSREQDDYGAKKEKKFLDAHPNIKLNKVVKEGDPGNEFYQGVAAGNAPDMIEVSFTMMDKYMRAGILQPLNDYVKSWDQGSKISKDYLNMFTIDGKIYGVPTAVAPMFFGYNKKLFAEAGLKEAPKDWNQMVEYAKKLKNADKQQYGYGILSAEWTEWFFQYYVWQAGGDLTQRNNDATMKLTFTDPAVIQAAQLYQTLMKEKVTQPDLTLKFDELIKKFAAGKIAMMPFAGDWVSWVTSLGMDPDDIGISLFPAGPSGKQTTAIGGSCMVINAKSSKDKQDAAWEYIKYLRDAETIKADFKNVENKGVVNPVIIPREDLALGDIVKLPEEYSKVLKDVQKEGRLEFYGKATVGIYVDKAVQKILTDLTANPEKVFKDAQTQAEKEVLDKFNKEATGK